MTFDPVAPVAVSTRRRSRAQDCMWRHCVPGAGIRSQHLHRNKIDYNNLLHDYYMHDQVFTTVHV